MTERCPITYEVLPPGQRYSTAGLKRLSPQLKNLHDLEEDSAALRSHALSMADKLSIQGVQFKLSAKLSLKEEKFQVCASGGRYILKPPSPDYEGLPENEDLTMRLAAMSGIHIPPHGLVYASDRTLTYWVKRFDRQSQKEKIPLEDFAQLSGRSRDTKYDSSMEKVAEVIEAYATFPQVELAKLFRLVVFNFLVGNEDAHLKNYSLITTEGQVTLSPVYDLVNSTIVLKNAKEEFALPLRGKKRNLTYADIVDYYGQERLGLNPGMIDGILSSIKNASSQWSEWIQKSFLTATQKDAYERVVRERRQKMGF